MAECESNKENVSPEKEENCPESKDRCSVNDLWLTMGWLSTRPKKPAPLKYFPKKGTCKHHCSGEYIEVHIMFCSIMYYIIAIIIQWDTEDYSSVVHIQAQEGDDSA